MKPFIFSLICTLFGVIVTIIFVHVNRYMRLKRLRELEYERKYQWIQKYIWQLEVNIANYERIKRMFTCMNKLPFKDHRRSCELFTEFLLRFESAIKELQSEDEFLLKIVCDLK